jgi:hypothetical protein
MSAVRFDLYSRPRDGGPCSWMTTGDAPVLIVERCVRGWWTARPAVRDAGDERRALGVTRQAAVGRHRAGRYDGPCPGCTCATSTPRSLSND